VNLIGCCPEIDTWRVACYTGIVCHSRASPTELIIEVSCYCERSSTATCDQWYQVLDLIPFHPAPDAQEAHKMFLYYQGTIISNWQCVFLLIYDDFLARPNAGGAICSSYDDVTSNEHFCERAYQTNKRGN
jgi:hypothetical protein